MSQFKYLLETSTCIELLRGDVKVRQKCVEHNMLCCISAVTCFPFFCDLQQHHVLTGIRFLLLLIVS